MQVGYSMESKCDNFYNTSIQALLAFGVIVFGLTSPEDYCYSAATECK